MVMAGTCEDKNNIDLHIYNVDYTCITKISRISLHYCILWIGPCRTYRGVQLMDQSGNLQCTHRIS